MHHKKVAYFLLLHLISVSKPISAADNNLVKTIYLKDYIVHCKSEELLVVDKKTFTTHVFETPHFTPSNYLHTNGNYLAWRSGDTNISWNVCTKMDNYQRNKAQLILGAILLFLAVPITVYFLRKHRTKLVVSQQEITTERHSLYEKLFQYNGNNLRTQEIDELFDIQKLSYDSRKLKRHRLIQEINKKHPNLIVRIKDKEDQRKYLYIINKQTE